MEYLFFDIECANSFDGGGKICEFGYVITDEQFQIKEKKMYLIDVYAKLNAAEEQIHQGNVLDADESLKSLRKKYNV